MVTRLSRHHTLPAFATAAAVDVPAELFADDDAPRYNIAPGGRVWIMGADLDGEVSIEAAQW
ncbi:MAG TPA: hypothetical protein VF178_04160, partial [Gemmatimonadaceae bacterium]